MTFAFIIESVSGTEWLVLLGVILIVVGPKNLPAAARKMGQVMSTLRRAADEFKRQLMTMDQEITKAVSDEPSSSSSSSTSSTSSEAADSSAQSDSGEQSEPYVDPYQGDYQADSPYPGHEDFYDETHYEDGSSPVDVQSDAQAASPSPAQSAAPAEGRKTEAELNAVKITVSSADGGSRKRK